MAHRAVPAVLLFAVLAALALPSTPDAETLRQDFDSMADLKAFWDISTWGGENRTHSAQNVSVDSGVLVLKLSGSQPGEKPVCAEITSKRSDFKYGSYRASIKTSKTPGGVVGWFTYRDSPLNEIDVEMLTKDISDLHFTLHHIQTNVDYKLKKLDFDPSAAFHEYRFDWYPDKVEYFVDGKPYATLSNKVPDMESRIMLNHWSGNIAGWGGPAPTRDMFMYVDWMAFSTEYGAPTRLLARYASPMKTRHPAAMSFDGEGMRFNLPGLAKPAVPAALFTVQGRFTIASTRAAR